MSRARYIIKNRQILIGIEILHLEFECFIEKAVEDKLGGQISLMLNILGRADCAAVWSTGGNTRLDTLRIQQMLHRGGKLG